MARTTETRVREATGGRLKASVSFQIHIDTASKLVDKLSAKVGSELDEQQLELIETWLTAHFVTLSNPEAVVQSKSIDGASVTYQKGQVSTGLEATQFGQQAMAIDTSGCLAQLMSGNRVTADWLGSNETDYDPDEAWN